MKKRLARCFGLILALMVLAAASNIQVWAANSPAKSNNIHDEDPDGNWAKPMKSYLVKNDDEFTRVEYIGNRTLVVETYDSDLDTLQSKQTISLPMTQFGGFFSGSKYNFVVVGKNNPKYSNSREVIRVIRYSKKWKELGHGGLLGGNTLMPFAAGSLRMDEYGDYIYIHTSHTMYPSSDKLNHQANVNFCYNQKKDKITDFFTGIGNLDSKGYVSHSFNQFVRVDSSANVLTVDLGDGYPRAIVLTRFSDKAGNKTYIGKTTSVELHAFSGSKGDNYTGASMGGFEVSKSKYLVAYSFKQSAGGAKNVYLATVSRNKFSKAGLHETKITNYSSAKETSASVPMLVKIDHSNFVLLWESISAYSYKKQVHYVLLNEKGKATGKIQTVSGCLSDCQPVVDGNTVCWYTTDNAWPVFYKLNFKTGKVSSTDMNGDNEDSDSDTTVDSGKSTKSSSSSSSSSSTKKSSSSKKTTTYDEEEDDEDDEEEEESSSKKSSSKKSSDDEDEEDDDGYTYIN